jgi:hypothetical protein
MISMIDYEEGGCNPEGSACEYYWTSTTYLPDTNMAFMLYNNHYGIGPYVKSAESQCYAKCVRFEEGGP